FSFSRYVPHPYLHSFPTRRSSDLSYQGILGVKAVERYQIIKQADVLMLLTVLDQQFDLKTKYVNWNYYFPITDHDYGSSLTPALDRKSTRLNSSHRTISYAVFCLK